MYVLFTFMLGDVFSVNYHYLHDLDVIEPGTSAVIKWTVFVLYIFIIIFPPLSVFLQWIFRAPPQFNHLLGFVPHLAFIAFLATLGFLAALWYFEIRTIPLRPGTDENALYREAKREGLPIHAFP